MLVSIVIPNYNGKKYIKTCLESIKKQTYKDFEVIFVDNGSSDGSVDYVKAHYPEILLITLEENFGFSIAVNRGIEKAQGDYVVLLNTDTEATDNWLYELVTCVTSNSKIFSCASKMLQYYDKDKIDDAGDFYSILGWAYQDGHDESASLYTEDRYIFSSCAGAAIYRKSLFEKVGLFDERFFAYLEDVDIGYRAQIEGYFNYFCSKAIIYHIGSATSGGGYSPFKVKLSSRNNLYLIYKNMPLIQIVLNIPFILIGIIIKYLFFRRKNLGIAYKEGLIEGLKTLKSVNKKSFKLKDIGKLIKIQYWLTGYTLKYAYRKLRFFQRSN
ncbi:hypothetical protein PM3016_552 [Paenibacillus mucilaginosus 3016]|uniref:Glycosyltransferase 2-like domain-containing protein n=2 Tax=Paenibacillus mucilaginosus TaxID=61624 RepID=H6NSX8_9BACL|nr:hypothetical protein PM3016_552 [Paenibacillus mucilaginosus 3016]WFA22446.1 glycosyltransferase family 2 protein [Paenibacillus mucilaginosus]